MDEFYVNLTSGKTECSWVLAYYGIVSKAINDNNFKKCAEVGIGYGLHAKEILDNTNLEHLYLIDPYHFYPNDFFVDDVNRSGGFEVLAKNVKLNLDVHKSRYTWYRKCSTEVTNDEIPNDFLDLVFIDADHSYIAVTNDLNFWWEKIRKGGWLMGDDYMSCWPETKKAVDDWANKMNLKIQFREKKHPVVKNSKYLIYYFIKN